MEICLESEAFPALYIASSSSLSSFSTGRRTSLIVDFSATGTSVVPVVDGYALSKPALFTSRGGVLLDNLLRRELEGSLGIPIRPWFEVKSACDAKYRLTTSFRELHVMDVVRDVKHWMFRMPSLSTPALCDGSKQLTGALPPPYELPDGTLVQASSALCALPEKVFFGDVNGDQWLPTTSAAAAAVAAKKRLGVASVDQAALANYLSSSGSASSVDTDSLTTLVYASVAHCDVDVRRELLSNVMLVGGGALMEGLALRLSQELAQVVPSHLKVKVVSLLPMEHQYAAWIGGSILSICGSFQQLWLSRSEYEEQGAWRSAQRFDH